MGGGAGEQCPWYRENSLCKGPGAGMLVCRRNSEGLCVWSRVSEGERGRRGRQGEDGTGCARLCGPRGGLGLLPPREMGTLGGLGEVDSHLKKCGA